MRRHGRAGYKCHSIQTRQSWKRLLSGSIIMTIFAVLAACGIRRAATIPSRTSIAGEIERKLAQLQGLRAMLKHLAASCQGDTRQNCPIIDGLSGRGRERAMAPRRAAGLNPAR